MEQAWVAMVVALLVLLASMASVELGISVALIEISLGVIAMHGDDREVRGARRRVTRW